MMRSHDLLSCVVSVFLYVCLVIHLRALHSLLGIYTLILTNCFELSLLELERASPWERYLSLLRLFEKCHPEVLTPLSVPTKNGYSRERALSNMDSFEELKCHANASLIHVLRTDDVCRRLASLAMRPYDPSKWPKIHGYQQQQRKQHAAPLVNQSR